MAKKVDKDLARYALQGIEAAIEKMQRQAAELRRLVGASRAGRDVTIGATPHGVQRGRKRRRKRTMSAAARKRISDAQKARWAKRKAAAKSK